MPDPIETEAELHLPPEDLLGALPLSEIETDNEALPAPPADGDFDEEDPGAGALSATASFSIDPSDEPQERGTKIHATDSRTGQRFYVGQVTHYPKNNPRHRGLSRRSDARMYDRAAAATRFGDWAHFIWPTVLGESGGQEIVINAWDRACFTWGFYQLAAHTAGDNLILLMRELVMLPSCATYFPDLTLDAGKLARKTPSGIVSLERTKTVTVGNGSEEQLIDFMDYLNPSSKAYEIDEAVTCARFIAWASDDPEMLATTGKVSIDIMKRRLKARATSLGLMGKRPELAIWVSDILHQARGTTTTIKAALAKPTLNAQLSALSKIDKFGTFGSRLKTVDDAVQTLIREGRFTDAKLGFGTLTL